MIVNNELVNRLIREGESQSTFSVLPDLAEIMDESGKLLQSGPRVPILDGIRVVIATAFRLHPAHIHPVNLSTVSILRQALEAVVVSLERIEPAQQDCATPEPKRIKSEVKDAIRAYEVAGEVCEAVVNEGKLTMQAFVKLIDKSPNPELTKDLLVEAGHHQGGWITSGGQLPALRTFVPATLPSSRALEVQGTISNVDDRNGTALLTINEYRNEQTRALLEHHPAQVQLHFNEDGIEREDLLIIQYRKQAVWLKVSAACATHARHAKKTSLTLTKILMNRTAMNSLHSMVSQMVLDLDPSLPSPELETLGE